jgi:hypothetical protein
MRAALWAALLIGASGVPAQGHRLDEYLQGTIISVGKDRVDAQLTLTPGVAVFPLLAGEIDRDRDGIVSTGEQQAYAQRILRDLTLRVDGRPLTAELTAVRFPALEEMKEGRGEIQVEFAAKLPRGGVNRRLTFENHHQSRIAAYQVNCLVSRVPEIRIVTQKRNYSQSWYELSFVQTGAASQRASFAWWPGAGEPAELAALFLAACLALWWRLRGRRLRSA